MQKSKKIDYSKLLGFDSVSDRTSGEIDFQDETMSARLGAKVGTVGEVEPVPIIAVAQLKAD